MGGRPSKGTQSDKRLKKNRKRRSPTSQNRAMLSGPRAGPPVVSKKPTIANPSPVKGRKGTIYG